MVNTLSKVKTKIRVCAKSAQTNVEIVRALSNRKVRRFTSHFSITRLKATSWLWRRGYLFVQTQIGICFAVYFCENCATTATTKGKITETPELQKVVALHKNMTDKIVSLISHSTLN